jgi:hypothetical protein
MKITFSLFIISPLIKQKTDVASLRKSWRHPNVRVLRSKIVPYVKHRMTDPPCWKALTMREHWLDIASSLDRIWESFLIVSHSSRVGPVWIESARNLSNFSLKGVIFLVYPNFSLLHFCRTTWTWPMLHEHQQVQHGMVVNRHDQLLSYWSWNIHIFSNLKVFKHHRLVATSIYSLIFARHSGQTTSFVYAWQ